MSVDVDFHIVAEADNPYYEEDERPQLLFIIHPAGDDVNEMGRLGGTPTQLRDALAEMDMHLADFLGDSA